MLADEEQLRIEARPVAAALIAGLALPSALAFRLLSRAGWVEDFGPFFWGVSWLLLGCALLLMLRVLIRPTPWIFDRRSGRLSGPGVSVPLTALGAPGVSTMTIGATEISSLLLPVAGKDQRLLSHTVRGPVEVVTRELADWLKVNEQAAAGPAVRLGALQLRRQLVGGGLLLSGLALSLIFWWFAPEARVQGLRLWVLVGLPVGPGLAESAGVRWLDGGTTLGMVFYVLFWLGLSWMT